MKKSVLFLLAAAVATGCANIGGDMVPPEDGPDQLLYIKTFEAGRRAESRGDIRIAGDTYGWLVKQGSRYGEYGLAQLILRRDPGSCEAVKNLIACAKRSSHTSAMFPDSAMDSAFSVAAMVRLAEIAVSEHDRPDVAASLRSMAADVVTPKVQAWVAEKKGNADSSAIYCDIVATVESCRPSREYVKAFKWPELGEVFLKGGGAKETKGSGGKMEAQAKSTYSVVKFVKSADAACQYDFEVQLEGGSTFEDAEKVRSAIRRQLLKEFMSANPHEGVDNVRMSFLSWSQQGESIKGSAVVMKVSTVRLEYDDKTRRGKIAVRLDGRDVITARKWVLENIEELASGKNIALVGGRPPPKARYYSLGEKIDGNVMEIEFRTE